MPFKLECRWIGGWSKNELNPIFVKKKKNYIDTKRRKKGKKKELVPPIPRDRGQN